MDETTNAMYTPPLRSGAADTTNFHRHRLPYARQEGGLQASCQRPACSRRTPCPFSVILPVASSTCSSDWISEAMVEARSLATWVKHSDKENQI